MTIEQMDQEYLLSTYNKNYISFVSGKGAKLYDDAGFDYIDFASGIGVSSVGHGNEKLSDAICEQAKKIIHISNLQVIEPQVKLAKKIVELSGYDMACFFGNSGAEANEAAVKIARKHGFQNFETKKFKIITVDNSFHGRTITTLKATGQDSFHTKDFSPYPDGFVYAQNIDDIYKKIDDQTVAVMIELVQGEGGVQPFDKTKIQKLAKKLKDEKILLIVDEVQTGIYRTGAFLASNLYEIEPDIITLAKGLGGGVPIGVAMTNLKEIFEPGDHGSTFGGNYLSTRAGEVVLSILEQEKNSGELVEKIDLFEEYLINIVNKYPDLFEKRVGLGLMLGLRAWSKEIQQKVIQSAFENRLILLRAGRDTVRMLPPLTITTKEINEGFKRFEKAISNI